jgi:hypothetical protein
VDEQVTVTFATDDLAVARFHMVNITLIRGAVTSEFLDASMREGRSLALRYPNGVGSLTLVMMGVPIPNEALRARASEAAKESQAWLRAGASVVKGAGFGASVVRSFLTAVTLLTSGPPRRTFSEPSPAVSWLSHALDVPALVGLLTWSERALSDSYRELLTDRVRRTG